MKPKALIEEMTEILKSLGYKIRKDNGTFNGGACLFKNEKIIVLNKNMPDEVNLKVLSSVLYEHLDEIYIKPRIREFIEKEGLNIEKSVEIIINKEG
jgi:hypothetical protein